MPRIARNDDVFCLYLWRSVDAPGTLYLARGIQNARAICLELIAAGYIVKVVQLATNAEYELRQGSLVARRVAMPPRRHSAAASSMPQPIA